MCVCKTSFIHACETIYLCMCVRLYIFICVWDYIYTCVWDYPLQHSDESNSTSTLLLLKLNEITNTLWNEEMTKIKVGDLDELYNIYIHHLYSWNHLVLKISFEIVIFWNSKFELFKISDKDRWLSFKITNLFIQSSPHDPFSTLICS